MDADRRARLERHLRIIDAGVAPVTAAYGEHMQCRPGCDACCHQSFSVSALEGEYLRMGLQALPADVRADIMRRARAYQPEHDMPCPVLSSAGQCRLYAYRPRICRKYGIPLWHPDRPHEVRTCPKNFRDVTDVDPDLILEPQAKWAEDWLMLREELALKEQRPQQRSIAAMLLLEDVAEADADP